MAVKVCAFLIELIILALLILTPLMYAGVLPSAWSILETAAALILILLLPDGLTRASYSQPTAVFVLAGIFMAYAGLQLFSSYIAPMNGYLSSLGLKSEYLWATRTELFKAASYAVLFYASLVTFRTKKRLNRVFFAIISMGFIVSVFYMLRQYGIKAPRCFINSDHLSAYLGMVISLAIGLIYVPWQAYNRQPSVEKRIFLFFVVIIMVGALFLTMSRGGIFSFTGALAVMAVCASAKKSLSHKRWIFALIAVFLVAIVVWLEATPAIERLLNVKAEIASVYLGDRLHIWRGTFEMIKKHPLFGTGLGTYAYVFPAYQPVETSYMVVTNAHSDYIELASDTGMIGLAIFLIGMAIYGAYVLKRFKDRNDPYVTGISMGLFGALASIFLHSSTDFSLHMPANAILLCVLMGLFPALLDYRGEDKFSGRTGAGQGGKGLLYIIYPAAAALAVVFAVMSIRFSLAWSSYDRALKNNGMSADKKRGFLAFAAESDPLNGVYRYELGNLYFKEGRTKSAVIEYKKAISLNPTNSLFHQTLARTYGYIAGLKGLSVTGKRLYTQAAAREFEKAIELEPNYRTRRKAYEAWRFSRDRGATPRQPRPALAGR